MYTFGIVGVKDVTVQTSASQHEKDVATEDNLGDVVKDKARRRYASQGASEVNLYPIN